MNQSESVGALAKALANAQGMMRPAELDGRNPQFRSKYATLGAVIEAIRPTLAPNGLAFTQHISRTPEGEIEVTTCVMHESGEWMSSTLGVPFDASKGVTMVQAMGGAITYIKRYGLTSVFGVYGDEDVDGNEQGTPPDVSSRAAVAERQAAAGRAVIDIDSPMPTCPKCNGAMWDNRHNKTNPKAPDFKCKDKECGGAIWPARTADEEWAEIMALPNPAGRWNDNVAILKRLAIYTSKSLGLSNEEVHVALGVGSAKDYEGSLEEAGAMLQAYAEMKPGGEL